MKPEITVGELLFKGIPPLLHTFLFPKNIEGEFEQVDFLFLGYEIGMKYISQGHLVGPQKVKPGWVLG